MQLEWFGLAAFRLTTREATIIIDPYEASVGLKFPRMQCDILLTTSGRPAHGNVAGVGGEPFVITGPGEYEAKKVSIWGQAVDTDGDHPHRTTLYIIEGDDLTVAHLGDLGVVLKDDQLDRLEGVDILLIPVGGNGALDAKKATELMSEIEPRIVIPMLYASTGVKLPLDPLAKFSKEFGVKDTEPIQKYKISKKDLPQDETRVVILTP